MDYRFIQPLYTNKEPDAAIEYLINILKDHIGIQIDEDRGIDDNNIDIIKIMAASNIVQNVYGVNAIDMANYFKVQDYFYKYYADSILRYFNIFGFNDVNYIRFRPSTVVPTILSNRIESEEFRPLNNWNPKDIWLSYEYTDDYDSNIMNPINNLDHVFIMINNMDKHEELVKNLVFTGRDFKIFDNNIKYLIYKLLPAKNMRGLLFFVKTLHKYL